jgi:tRNA U34 5-methylaminomethyl-2-thiouridine-forming methyltransferase MnmC
MLAPDGVLVTYCSKGDVRRAMQAAGFQVEKIPGPAWKREMIRATRSVDKGNGQ